jgi:phosphoserine phosphatase RsbU/P
MQTILVVDDEQDFRQGIKRRLESRGFRVLEAADGVEGFSIFQEERRSIALVITDVRMPKMGGEELTRVIRALDPIVPILGVTAHQDAQDQLSILGCGAYYYLAKPLPNWPIVDKLIGNAIACYLTQKSERESSRLVSGYVLSHSIASLVNAPVDLAIQQIDSPRPSGDFAEAMQSANGEIIFYIADASGHNDLVPSFMACLASIILHRSQYSGEFSSEALLARVDESLRHLRSIGVLGGGLYLTFFLGQLDWENGLLRYVNAGHPGPFLFRPRESKWDVRVLGATAPPVGMDSPVPFSPRAETVDLVAGDLLFLYSDGASELLGDGPGEEGRERLKELVLSCLPASPEVVVAEVKEQLILHAGGPDRFEDDTTLMAIRLAPARKPSL